MMIHPKAICESTDIGDGTRIWAYAHILPGARIGADCNICDGVFIESKAAVGDRVTIKCGVQLWDGITLEDDVFVGPNATFCNDPFPRSGHQMDEYPQTRVQRGASIGANATILSGLTIGSGAMIGAGSVVTRSVPQHAIVAGNPARITGYVDAKQTAPDSDMQTGEALKTRAITDSPDAPARLIRFDTFSDIRGHLAVTEFDDLPFVPARCFFVHDVPSKEVRGEHAHRQCHQLLICVSGEVSVMVDDGHERAQVVLDSPDLGLHVPPMVWASQFCYSGDAVLMVLASMAYDPDDYIRDYDRFIDERKS